MAPRKKSRVTMAAATVSGERRKLHHMSDVAQPAAQASCRSCIALRRLSSAPSRARQAPATAASGPKPSKPTQPIIAAPSAAAPIQPTLAEVPFSPSTVPRTSSGTAARAAM